MKKLIYQLSFLLCTVLFLAGCEKERTFPEFHEIEHGAYPRQLGTFVGPNGKDFNYNDPANASVTFNVEFYDDQNGACVESYCWTANHAPTGTSAQIGCLNKSQFGVNPENGRPTATFTFTLQQALDALGLTIDQVTGGEAIDFYATLTTCKGQTFDRFNTNSVTQGQPAFKALFQFKSNLICPSELAGTFDAVTVGQSVWAGTPCSSTWSGQVIWEHEGNGVYDVFSVIEGNTLNDMSMGGYFACYGGTAETGYPNGAGGTAGTLRIADACGKLAITGLSQWGEDYVINNLTVNGNQLTIDWTNSYGESAITTLTRTDGKNWPANLRK
ncbi:MAG: hypothetical protein ABIQ11_03100 [Saprospiraceae bacterium]